jgi:O-antigen ligase
MKSKAYLQTPKPHVSLFEYAFLALPFFALIPNTFVPPPLGHEGLATQEFVFACTAAVFAGLGLAQIFRAQPGLVKLSRENLLMFVALGVFILWQIISLSWAPAVYDGARVAGVWLGFAIFFVAGLSCLRKRSAEWLHYALSIVAVALAISVIQERLTYGNDMRGTFFNHGISAELMATILPMQVLTYLTARKKWLAIFSFAVTGLSAAALLAGLRRGPITGAVVTLIVIGLALSFKLIKMQSRARLWIAAALVALVIAAVGIPYRHEIALRIEGATQIQSEEGGLTTRLRTWITAWEMGKSNAMIGVGNAGYPSLYGSYRRAFVSNPKYAKIAESAGAEDFDEIRSPLVHNEYLEIFVELGVVGLLLFFAFWVCVVRALWWRIRGADNVPVIGALLGLMAFGISSFASAFSLRYTPQAFIVPCVLGVGFAFARTDQGDNDERQPSLSLPKAAAAAVAAVALVACAMFAVRAFNVLSSQRIQGSLDASVAPIDFQFFPNNPSGNEMLQRRYERALEFDPENAGAHLGYGLLLFQMKQPDRAIPHVEFASKRGYSRPFANVLLAFAHEQTGQVARGAEILGQCAASFPQSFFVRAAYAEMLRKAGKIEQAREQLMAMHNLNPHEAQSWELAMRRGLEEATAEAKQRGLIPPEKLRPILAATLVRSRAYHYLK